MNQLNVYTPVDKEYVGSIICKTKEECLEFAKQNFKLYSWEWDGINRSPISNVIELA